MRHTMAMAAVTALSVGIVSCDRPAPPAEPFRVMATELYDVFQADEGAARERFGGRLLVITGEVSSYWGAGPPGAQPSIAFRVASGGIVSCPGSSARYSALNRSLQLWDCY